MTDWRTKMCAGLSIYMHARYDHAWLLRAEGLTFAEIGVRMGCGAQNASRMVYMRGRWAARSMQHARFTIYAGKETTGHTIHV